MALPPGQLAEIDSAADKDKLCVHCRVDFDHRRLSLMLASGRPVDVPFEELGPSGNGLAPDFTDVYITDHGLTLCLGEYEAAVDAITR